MRADFPKDPIRADFPKNPLLFEKFLRKQNFIFKNWTKENLNSHPFIELMIFVKKVELKIYLKKLCYNTSLMKKDYFLSNFHAISETMSNLVDWQTKEFIPKIVQNSLNMKEFKTHHYFGSWVHRQWLMIKKSSELLPNRTDCFQITLRVNLPMKNIKIINHILFELTLATCISKVNKDKSPKNPPISLQNG